MKKTEELIEEKLQTLFNDRSLKLDRSRFAGGMTNNNYIMEIHDIEYVIREPGFMTSEMIDRKIEGINNNIASKLGINSDCIYFDDDTGIKISIYIKNSVNVALANPCSRNSIVAVCQLLKKIHNSCQPFPNTFEWAKELGKYEDIIKKLGGDLFSDYYILKKQLLDYMSLTITETSLVPCHNDTVPENFITGYDGRIYLIDWEYSGMNDPAFDVAAYILESRLPADCIDAFLNNFYDSHMTDLEIKKIQCYMMAQDLLWTIWALIRHYGGEDFLDYCSLRYDRFKKNLMSLLQDHYYPISEMVKPR